MFVLPFVLWAQRGAATSANGRYREGVGVAVGGWRGGLEPAAALCHVDASGVINVVVGAVDLSGTFTTLRMIVAETIGVDYDLVRVVGSDSSNAPYSGGSGGSKIIYTVGQAVMRAAEDAKGQILELAVPFAELGAQADSSLHMFLEAFSKKQSLDRAPREGAIELTVPSPDFELIMWQA